jgi:leader peptidase (prepilin peptidase)/N-methyltransferase
MFISIAAVAGILCGILINRAADNLPPPHRRSLFSPPRCPYCDTSRDLIEQFGLVSFAVRRDRCHSCGAPLRLRAPLMEFLTGIVFAFLAARYSFNLYFVIICAFSALLILVSIIDLEHKLILTVLVLPATVLALIAGPILFGGAAATLQTLRPERILLSLLGAIVGYAITLAMYWFGQVFVRFMNRNRRQKITTVAFGFGDVRLGGLLGALVGFPAIFYAILYAVLLGGIGALVAILLATLRQGQYRAFTAIPYGPIS